MVCLNCRLTWRLSIGTTVGILAGIAFLAAIVGNIVAFGNRFVGAILTAVFFAVFYVAWLTGSRGWLCRRLPRRPSKHSTTLIKAQRTWPGHVPGRVCAFAI